MMSILEAALEVAFCRVGWLDPQLLPDFSGCFAFAFSGFLWQNVSFKRGQKKRKGGGHSIESGLSLWYCLPHPTKNQAESPEYQSGCKICWLLRSAG